jgi:hypothetical protein
VHTVCMAVDRRAIVYTYSSTQEIVEF